MNDETLENFLRSYRPLEKPDAVSKIAAGVHSFTGFTLNFNMISSPIIEEREDFKMGVHGRFSPVPNHDHNYFEMMYVYSGQITQIVDGENIVLKKGSFCFIAPETQHSIETCGENDIGVNFIMSKELFTQRFFTDISENSLFFNFFSKALFSSQSKDFPKYIVLHTDNDVRIRKYTTAIMCEYFDPSICSAQAIGNLLPLLFNELFRIWLSSKDESYAYNPKGSADIRSFLRHIEANFASATLASTAKRFGYTPNYLGILLRQTTGRSFKDIKHQLCMSHAATMLAHSDLSIDDIALAVGFSNKSFFYKLFQRHFKMTPGEYRARSLNKL